MNSVTKIFACLLFICNNAFSQTYSLGDKTTAQDFAALPKAAAPANRDLTTLPPSVSLKPYAPNVGNQGTYGTCVAWSSAYAARTISYAIHHNMQNKDSITNEAFSPGYLYYYIKSANDANCSNGASIYNAMEILEQKGAVLKSEGVSDCSAQSPGNEDAKAVPFKIKDFLALSDYGGVGKNDVLKIKKSLAEQKPVIMSFKCMQSFFAVPATGFWSPAPNDVYKGDHAMCIIGYDDNINGGSFEVMNSWGTYWGNKGFFWLNYGLFTQYGNYAVEMMDFESAAPKLAGSLDFVLTDNTVMPVERTKINSRSIQVEDDDQADYSQYKISQIYPGGTAFKIKFTTSAPAYVYIFSEDNKQVISTIFPYNPTISAAINSNNTTIYLPSETKHARLSMDRGKENICVLYSKEKLDFNGLVDYINSTNKTIYEAVKDKFADKLISLKQVQFSDKAIQFTAPANDNSIICFFISLEHN